MKSLSRITAVNRIIEMTSGEVISNLTDLATIPVAVKASNQLDYSTDKILTELEWFYNTLNSLTLTANVDGEIILPNNLTQIEFEQSTPVPVPYLSVVGGKVYDKRTQTTVLGTSASVTFSGQLTFDFEDLPFAFQMLAIADARLYIATGASHISPTRTETERKSYADALQTTQKFDDKLGGSRMRPLGSQRRRHSNNHGFI